jgi:hypothetical protein
VLEQPGQPAAAERGDQRLQLDARRARGADNFTVGQNWSLTAATVWGAYSSPATPPPSQDMVVRVFSNNAGFAGDAPVYSERVERAGGGHGHVYGALCQAHLPIQHVVHTDRVATGAVLGQRSGEPGRLHGAWARTNSTANAHAVRIGAGAWGFSGGDFAFSLCGMATPVACYPNCDQSTIAPILNVNDFNVFPEPIRGGGPLRQLRCVHHRPRAQRERLHVLLESVRRRLPING